PPPARADRAPGRTDAALVAGCIHRSSSGFSHRFGSARKELVHGGGVAPLHPTGFVCLFRDSSAGKTARALHRGRGRPGDLDDRCLGAGADGVEPWWARGGGADIGDLRCAQSEAGPCAGGAVALRLVGRARTLEGVGAAGCVRVDAWPGAPRRLTRGVGLLRPGRSGVRLARGAFTAAFSWLVRRRCRDVSAGRGRGLEDVGAFPDTHGPHTDGLAGFGQGAGYGFDRSSGHLARQREDVRSPSGQRGWRARLSLRLSAICTADRSFPGGRNLRRRRRRLPCSPAGPGSSHRDGRDRFVAVAGRRGTGLALLVTRRRGTRRGISGNGRVGGHAVSAQYTPGFLFGMVGIFVCLVVWIMVCSLGRELACQGIRSCSVSRYRLLSSRSITPIRSMPVWARSIGRKKSSCSIRVRPTRPLPLPSATVRVSMFTPSTTTAPKSSVPMRWPVTIGFSTSMPMKYCRRARARKSKAP